MITDEQIDLLFLAARSFLEHRRKSGGCTEDFLDELEEAINTAEHILTFYDFSHK
jgi:hypothetical protein